MALFVRQEEGRSKLQQQIAAELQAKAKAREEEASLPDGIKDSRFIENTKQTTSLAWVWVLIVFAIIALLLWLVIQTFVS